MSDPTDRDLQAVRAIAAEHGMALASGWDSDAAFVRAFLDRLADDPPRNPLEKRARFLSDVTNDVQQGMAAAGLARRHMLPPRLAALLHAYASRRLGYADADDLAADLRRKRGLEEAAAVLSIAE
jgi:hypothetical protein